MVEVTLELPTNLVEALPSDNDDVAADMREAVAGWEADINRRLDADEGALVDILDRFETRWEQYDQYIVELRAWGQSPIYAMAWRDLQESILRQLYDHEDIAERLDRERHARIVEDGIRPMD